MTLPWRSLVIMAGFACCCCATGQSGPPDDPIAALKSWLDEPRTERASLATAAFARTPLTLTQAQTAQKLLWSDHADLIRETRQAEMNDKLIQLGDLKLRFDTLDFGDPENVPEGGRSLFLSLHGGGNTRPSVNDSQWRNQLRLGRQYAPSEGIYLAPRAPTDTWDLWHQAHIDQFFDRLIANLIVLSNVNPNRVYLMGYSAGGDGVYQVAPRMADRFAAAAMMAGHPNEASPLGLRNLPFAIQVGALDSAYKRNEVALEWGRKLTDLQSADPDGYTHFAEAHAGKRHWMELEDRKAIPWMEKFERNPLPDRVVWYQDDVTHERFYWLALPPGTAKQGERITATKSGQTISLEASSPATVLVRLNDDLLNLNESVVVRTGEQILFSGTVHRTIATILKTLEERGDPASIFSAEIAVEVPAGRRGDR